MEVAGQFHHLFRLHVAMSVRMGQEKSKVSIYPVLQEIDSLGGGTNFRFDGIFALHIASSGTNLRKDFPPNRPSHPVRYERPLRNIRLVRICHAILHATFRDWVQFLERDGGRDDRGYFSTICTFIRFLTREKLMIFTI